MYRPLNLDMPVLEFVNSMFGNHWLWTTLGSVDEWERIPERSSHNVLPMEALAGKMTSSLHESNFA